MLECAHYARPRRYRAHHGGNHGAGGAAGVVLAMASVDRRGAADERGLRHWGKIVYGIFAGISLEITQPAASEP